jgi:hypothetical protein
MLSSPVAYDPLRDGVQHQGRALSLAERRQNANRQFLGLEYPVLRAPRPHGLDRSRLDARVEQLQRRVNMRQVAAQVVHAGVQFAD